VIDANDVDKNVAPLCAFDSTQLGQRVGKELLRAEYLVAAPKRLDLRERFVERFYTDAHWVGVVDDPSLWAVIANIARNRFVHGNRPQGAHETARADRVADGLIDAVFFRRMYVGFHFVKRARHDRYNYKICTGERLFGRFICAVGKAAARESTDGLICLCCRKINVVEGYLAA